MEKGNTKQQILDAALDLFSVSGFEATSISQIADAVGIRKASLYSHFVNKQDILDTLVENICKQYEQHSLYVSTNWDEIDPEDPRFQNMTPEIIAQQVKGQMRYILHDPDVSKARKMLVIEQFRNSELSKMHSSHNYVDIMNYHVGMFRFLIRIGQIAEGDPEIMAAQYALPISAWLNLCDREPDREEEVMELIERHVLEFFRTHRK